MYTWFCNFRIDTVEDWFYCYSDARLWLMLVQLLHSQEGFPDLLSACARMDFWSLSGVAKALCGAVGTCIKYQGRPVCSCSRCALGTGGGFVCTLSGMKEINHNRKENWDWHSKEFLSRTSLIMKDDLSSWSPSREKLRRMHRTTTLALPLLLRDYFQRKTCPHLLDTNPFVSAPHLPYSSVCFRVK